MLDRSISICGSVLSREEGVVEILRTSAVDSIFATLVLGLPMLDGQADKSYGDDDLEPIPPVMFPVP